MSITGLPRRLTPLGAAIKAVLSKESSTTISMSLTFTVSPGPGGDASRRWHAPARPELDTGLGAYEGHICRAILHDGCGHVGVDMVVMIVCSQQGVNMPNSKRTEREYGVPEVGLQFPDTGHPLHRQERDNQVRAFSLLSIFSLMVSQFQRSVTFEIGFAIVAQSQIQGSSFKIS
jgi:hypothetical protein